MNPVFLKLGPIELHYYGLMYAIAFYVGITLGKKIAKERNFDVELVENYAFVAIISGLIGGRLYYVLFNLCIDKSSNYSTDYSSMYGHSTMPNSRNFKRIS